MSFWTAIAVIVIVGAISSVLRERYKAMGRTSGNGSGTERDPYREDALRQERDDAQSELASLRERVKVLERIATDGHRSNDLSDEIEKLRDR